MSEGQTPFSATVTTLYCPECGAPTAPEALMCPRCGATLKPMPTGGSRVQMAQVAYPTQVREYAGFWFRLVAALVDTLLIQVVVMPVALVMGALIGVAGVAVRMPTRGTEVVGMIGGFALGTLASWLYSAVMESSAKQATFGKMLLGLRVTDLNGERISFARASGRHFAKYLSAAILFIGYIMAGLTEKKQALHDMVAGTLVIRK